MSTVLPGNLGEVLPLRFRVRSEFRFEVTGDHVVAERLPDKQRFSLSLWQLEMLKRFDGIRTFEQASREVYRFFPRKFTTLDLWNFYRWLDHENLVVCAHESIFELVDDDSEEGLDVSQVGTRGKKDSPSSMNIEFNEWQFQALKISAAVIFCLCVFRIVYVAAPLFEPPVDLSFYGHEGTFTKVMPANKKARREQKLPETTIEKLELAVLAKGLQEVRPAGPELGLKPKALSVPDRQELMSKIDELRRQLAECQVRRNEFYIQNHAAGYHREVTKMTDLLRQINEIESRL